jgi:hypothetical protein
MRRAAYIVGGSLIGWLVLGSVAAILVETIVYYLDVEWNDVVHRVFYGLLALAGLVGGGVLGAALADRRTRSPEPLEAAVQPEGTAPETSQMQRLLDLHAEGVLSREELDAARARLLDE